MFFKSAKLRSGLWLSGRLHLSKPRGRGFNSRQILFFQSSTILTSGFLIIVHRGGAVLLIFSKNLLSRAA